MAHAAMRATHEPRAGHSKRSPINSKVESAPPF
eukprot:CAMPEP_0182562026 /NCGR_PEP_ID=MMETSP1324-20130603/4432_1 /TAXON_ID=236786 /ORGANISM="Florenciella sp., Strain RCC1587" /LENGTH=32 /DNA_ID= /DNA_START= /DNA_END= /DNA_ORIENTATION=